MSRAMKEAIVEHLARALDGHDSAVVVNAGRMTVAETEDLRTKLREQDVKLFYLRNRLARIALPQVGYMRIGGQHFKRLVRLFKIPFSFLEIKLRPFVISLGHEILGAEFLGGFVIVRILFQRNRRTFDFDIGIFE